MIQSDAKSPAAPDVARRFDSLEQEAYLALWRTYDKLRAIEDTLFARWDLTAQQYNVLRLLEAAHPEPVPTLGLQSRLVSRAPDITRMLDKLESRGFLSRTRSELDRRAVLVSLTPAGQTTLAEIVEPLGHSHERQLGHLSENDLRSLIRLLKKARAPHEPSKPA